MLIFSSLNNLLVLIIAQIFLSLYILILSMISSLSNTCMSLKNIPVSQTHNLLYS